MGTIDTGGVSNRLLGLLDFDTEGIFGRRGDRALAHFLLSFRPGGFLNRLQGANDTGRVFAPGNSRRRLAGRLSRLLSTIDTGGIFLRRLFRLQGAIGIEEFFDRLQGAIDSNRGKGCPARAAIQVSRRVLLPAGVMPRPRAISLSSGSRCLSRSSRV